MIPHFGNWKLRKGDLGITDSLYGLVYFRVIQVKSDGRIFACLIPGLTNTQLRKCINRVITLSNGWKLL